MNTSGTESSIDRLISADSHVFESPKVWDGIVPADFWPDDGRSFRHVPGGNDPEARLEEMVVDGVIGEVLYPSLGLKLFSIEDPTVQADAFRIYNQWLADFCAADPKRLVGVGIVPAYDMDRAVEEVRFVHDQKMRGVMVWQAPHPDLPFTSSHYDRLWETAQSLNLPVSMHILTGFDYSRNGPISERSIIDVVRGAVNEKLLCVMNAVYAFMVGGVFDRFPDLRLVLVENEIGWLPFALDQWDYYFKRFEGNRDVALERKPSEYFARHVYATFFRDPLAGLLLREWGNENCMWSNDYPHGNTTWPKSREFVSERLGSLPDQTREKLIRGNVQDLYGAIGS